MQWIAANIIGSFEGLAGCDPIDGKVCSGSAGRLDAEVSLQEVPTQLLPEFIANYTWDGYSRFIFSWSSCNGLMQT